MQSEKTTTETSVQSIVRRPVGRMSKHGGKRKGAGRKPVPNGRSVPKSIKVSRRVADYLSERGTGIIEDTIRRTKDFREWCRSR